MGLNSESPGTATAIFVVDSKFRRPAVHNFAGEMMPKERPFLTADWKYLLMLNYEVDSRLLEPLVPAGTELDLWEGRAMVSVVGFLFHNTRVLGAPVPLHRNFEEVNLRFYVRQMAGDEVRRGVVFVKEIVPLVAVASVARFLYGENYVALPMGHTVERDRKTGALCRDGLVEYWWRQHGKLNRLGGLALGDPHPLEPGSEAEFIAEHYWGYTHRGKRGTGVYQVRHDPWRVWQVAQPYLLCNVAGLYGKEFVPVLRNRPRSAFLAEGSPVAVYPGETIRPERKLDR